MQSIALDPRFAAMAPVNGAGVLSRRKVILFVQVAWMVLLVSAGLIYPVTQADPANLVYPACLAATLTFVWGLWSWYALRGTLFEPYPLFLLSASLFNAGQAMLELFGLNGDGILRGRVTPDILVPALFLVSAGAAFLHGGALLALAKRSTVDTAASAPKARARATRWVGWFLLATAVVPTFNLFQTSFAVVMDHGYMSLFRDLNTRSTAVALSAFFVPGILFLLAGSKQQRSVQILCLTLTAGYAGIYLFLGARGSAAMVCVAVAWVYDRSIHRLSRVLVLLLALVAMVVFPLVRETRATGGRYRMSFDDQLETLSNLENPVSSSISEMGFSLVTVTHTLTLVPASRPYDWGASYWYALVAVIPNIGWDIHPTVAHGLLSDWLIKTVDPVVARAGGGLGVSFVAEAYLNFGWIGTPLWLGLVGFALSRLFLKADGADPARHAFAASFLSFFFIFARGEAAIVARGLIWYAVVPYLLVALFTVRARKEARA
jgi:oligosaccharide repeat unit polymerase